VPELPEVETTRRGIAPHVLGRTVRELVVRQPKLRWPVPETLIKFLPGQTCREVSRRAKYLLLRFDHGTVLIHLGMSGSLTVVDGAPSGPHDHVDIRFDDGATLRLNDPRRFGCVLWLEGDPMAHPLLKDVGPEPWAEGLGEHLYARSRGRRQAVKHFIMDGKIVAGVGNIYANEALFRAGIHPGRAAGRISLGRYEALAGQVVAVLEAALKAGGTTLRDFRGGDGKPGYFQQELAVYGRPGAPCPRCGTAIRPGRHGQRSTFFCPRCQR